MIKSLLDSIQHLISGDDVHDQLVEALKVVKHKRLVEHLEQRYKLQGIPGIDKLIEGVLLDKEESKKSKAKKIVETITGTKNTKDSSSVTPKPKVSHVKKKESKNRVDSKA